MKPYMTLLVGFTQYQADLITNTLCKTDSCFRPAVVAPHLVEENLKYITKVIISTDCHFQKEYTRLYCRLPNPSRVRMYAVTPEGSVFDTVDWYSLIISKEKTLDHSIVTHYYPDGGIHQLEYKASLNY